MLKLYNSCRQYTEYIPFVLLPLLLITEHELQKHAFNTSMQIAIAIITVTLFFILTMKFKIKPKIAFLSSLGLWVILIYIKRKMNDLKKV